MYISGQSIVLVVIIILLVWAIRKSYKSDMKHNKSKSELSGENKKPGPEYEHSVHRFFKDEVYKAFEAYKADGEKVSWEPENDGFSLDMEALDPMKDEMFSASVECDNNNKLNLADPYYLYITYSFTIKKDRSGYYKRLASFLNNYYKTHNMLNKELFFAHSVFTIEYSNIGKYICHLYLTDVNYLCRQTEAYGAKSVFDRLFITAKLKFTEGQKLYRETNEQILKDLK